MAILIHIKLIDQLGTYFHRWNLKIPDFLYITIVCSLTSNDKICLLFPSFCLLFPSQTIIFHSYRDVTIALTNPWHSAVAHLLTVELSSPVLTTKVCRGWDSNIQQFVLEANAQPPQLWRQIKGMINIK